MYKHNITTPPIIINQEAHQEFKNTIETDFQENPDSQWYGGYVEYEWHHLRYALSVLPFELDGKKILEFGGNIGASSIIIAHLGGDVTVVDVNPDAIKATMLNAASYGKESHIKALHTPDTTQLPFGDNMFDVIVANSVLEYVPRHDIDKVLLELQRVLRPQGIIMIMGTASSLALCEVHSKRWFVNYIPVFIERLLKKNWQRGISPFKILNAFKAYDFLEHKDYSTNYLRVRKNFGWSVWKCWCVKLCAYMLAPLGVTPSIFTPSITATFQKK